ncbi:MAG: isocitrate lyase/phosphoenolpyruvate mutase family protein [Dyadobacter sp.]|uniref:isocitrate lyase/PEP mutase family protein n=1 Tax=Dyadobacter sp. TaxID=1914288 RepID=UPI0032657709
MFNSPLTQSKPSEKADVFKKLHYSEDLLVLPNIWDVAGATLLEETGYRAVATASASIARANGYHDGENVPFEMVLSILSQIVKSVSVPVTADIESGYASDAATLKTNIRKLIGTGIAGINIEDSDPRTHRLLSIEIQAERIGLIRRVAEREGVRLFINARTDVYLRHSDLQPEARLEQSIERGKAYVDAGADAVYPILVKDEDAIATLVQELSVPVNILATTGVSDIQVLRKLGVARVSFGPNFQKAVLLAMNKLLSEVKSEGSHYPVTGI